MREKATRIKKLRFYLVYRRLKLYLKRRMVNRNGEIETYGRMLTENERLYLMLRGNF